MRTILTILISFFFINMSAVEEIPICIAANVPDRMDNLDSQSLQLLKSRIESFASNAGVSTQYNGSFVITPSVNVIDENIIEGGLRNIFRVNIEVPLSIDQLSTNTSFGSFIFELKGDGYTRAGAIKNAISKISPKNTKALQWIGSCKEKICSYYMTNKAGMIATAKTMALRGEYDKALAFLNTYPSTLSGYEDIVDAEIEIYLDCVRKECTTIINQAKAEYVRQNYESAITILSDIDPTCECSSEAQSFLAKIDNEIRSIQREEKLAAERERREERMAEERERREERMAEERERREERQYAERERRDMLRREAAERQMSENQKDRDTQIRVARMGVIQGVASSFISSLPGLVRIFF